MDYKEAIQQYADEIAWEKYGKENFYDLSDAEQDKVWTEAEERYTDNVVSQVDKMKERQKYEGR